MSTRLRRWGRVLVMVALAGGMLWGGWNAWAVRRHHRAIAEIEADMDDGLYTIAARKLIALLAQRPDSDEALYLLGSCELARGRTEPADAAWARVPTGSGLARRAILGRMQLRAERGRFAEAEQIVSAALDDPRTDGADLALSLGPVYCLQGRVAEAQRLTEARWEALDRVGEGASRAAIKLVRGYIEVRRSPIPVEMIGPTLDQALQMVPNDDRVWLGKANLAIRVGSYDEAARWLDACLRRRPADVPVWNARLDWAVATRRLAEAREAMTHLPVAETTPARVARLAAWIAVQRGDRAAEQKALERLITADPSDLSAFDRLAELAAREGQPARAAELRRQKSAIEQRTARYDLLYQRNQPARDAPEMARLAEQLGRSFEARAFLAVAIAIDPDRDDLRRDRARLDSSVQTNPEPARTLADMVLGH